MATRAGRTTLVRNPRLEPKHALHAGAVVALAVAVLGVAASGRRPAQRHGFGQVVAVGANVDVSNDPGVQSQVSVAVDPTDDRLLVAGSGNFGRETRAYSSTDGGSSWTTSADPPLPAGVLQACAFGDSSVGIDRLGRQYYAFIVGKLCDLVHLGSGVGAPELFVARRAGATAAWTTPVSPVAALYPGDALRPGEADDKPWLTVDVSPASAHANRAYVAWTRSGGAQGIRVLLSHTDDGAHTWSAPVRVNDHPLADGAIASVAVGSAGEVYVVWDDIAARTISIARSTDGGGHFDPSRLVRHERGPRTASCQPPGISIPAQPRRCVTADATVTVDNSNTRHAGRVYVSYADAGQNRAQHVFVAAFDAALHPVRAKPVNLPDRATPFDQFQPAAAVDRSTGTLWVCFYDTSGDPHRIRAVYSCTTSHDGSSSWSPPVRAASVASDEAQRGANRVGYGDYQGLAVAGGLAHPIWTDSRKLGTLNEEIYTTTLACVTPILGGNTTSSLPSCSSAFTSSAFRFFAHLFHLPSSSLWSGKAVLAPSFRVPIADDACALHDTPAVAARPRSTESRRASPWPCVGR
jgi:hypothetical protein